MILYFLFLKTETSDEFILDEHETGKPQTWNMVSIVLDVHLVQASLCRRVLHSDGAVLVVGDVRTSCSS